MATIDNIDIGVHFEYARRIYSVERTIKRFPIEQSQHISAHIRILNMQPYLQEIEELFGFRHNVQPWATFTTPKNFHEQRRSTFAFDRICPSLGSYQNQIKLLEQLKNLPYITSSKPEEQSLSKDKDKEKRQTRHQNEKKALIRCFEHIKNINSMISFITSRIGQFLQG